MLHNYFYRRRLKNIIKEKNEELSLAKADLKKYNYTHPCEMDLLGGHMKRLDKQCILNHQSVRLQSMLVKHLLS